VLSVGASGHDFDCALTNFVTVEIGWLSFEYGHVAGIHVFGC
jgi:hypothetical protein